MEMFGEAVRYRTCPTPGVPPVTCMVTGVFDEANVDQFAIENLAPGAVVNTRPVLGVQLSQFAAFGIEPAQDDVLTRVSNGRCYLVSKVREDSHGGARLDLNNASDTANPP